MQHETIPSTFPNRFFLIKLNPAQNLYGKNCVSKIFAKLHFSQVRDYQKKNSYTVKFHLGFIGLIKKQQKLEHLSDIDEETNSTIDLE